MAYLLIILNKYYIILLVIIMKINLNSWMNNIDDSKNLLSLTIPGTHDCVTQFVQLSHLSKCQDRNIYEQLSIGIRALDIRVKSNGEFLTMLHGKANAFNDANRLKKPMDMVDVLNHCYKFLKENPSEAIVFQFKNDNNKENEVCFNNLYYTYIKKNPEMWYLENRIPNLCEARGKLVLIRRCKMDTSNSEFTDNNTGIDFSSWVEQDKVTPEPLILETKGKDNAVFIIQDRYKYKPIERWEECLLPFLNSMEEFKGTYVINYTSTAGGVKGPEKNAGLINPKLLKYPLDKNKYYGTIYLDFPTEELTTKLIEHNL